MGLDDLMDDVETHPVGSVNSRKNSKNMEFRESSWKEVLTYYPYAGEVLSRYADDSDVRKIVSMMDDVLQNGLEGHKLSDDELQRIEDARDSLVEQKM